MSARGLVLGPAGAWGSWQAGVLWRWMTEYHVEFDSVLGISAGSLNAAAYFLGVPDKLIVLWSNVRNRDILIPHPKLFPFSLFSLDKIKALLQDWVDEEKAKKESRCTLYIMTFCVEDAAPWIGTFNPHGIWNCSLLDHIIASCSFPVLFPPVKINIDVVTKTLVDGAAIRNKAASFKLALNVDEVFLLNVLRPDDLLPFSLNPWVWLGNKGRRVLSRQMRSGMKSLQSVARQTRVYHFYPSQSLETHILNFSPQACRAAFISGAEDAGDFIRRRERYLLSPEENWFRL